MVPSVDEGICVNCGLCANACPALNVEGFLKFLRAPSRVFAAQLKDEALLSNSASGGAFVAIAQSVLAEGGVVYGCASEGVKSRHVRIDSLEGLSALQGSKYVQSEITGEVWRLFVSDLQNGTRVLFSGTPCQLAAARTLAGDNDNLIMVDLICHGVGAPGFLEQAVRDVERSRRCSVTALRFRTKIDGWGLLGVIETKEADKSRTRVYHPCLYPYYYYYYYLSGDVYRECCYSCPFARKERIGDFTVGDYWGIEDATLSPIGQDWESLGNAPRMQGASDTELVERSGVSVLLANSSKLSASFRSALSARTWLYETSLEDSLRKNGQLKAPSKRPVSRDTYERDYQSGALIGRFYATGKLKRFTRRIFLSLPAEVRGALRALLKRIK